MAHQRPDTDATRAAADRGETAWMLRWQHFAYWPLTIAALVFLVAYTVQVVGDIPRGLRLLTSSLILLTWFMFIVDYAVRLIASPRKWRWIRSNLFDLGVLFIPPLRPVRLLSAVTRILSLTRTAASSLRAQLLIYGIGSALLLLWWASLTVLEFERRAPDGNIRNFGDALWWAVCTITTVGYGDFVPVTPTGRLVAIVLMVGGVVLVGMIVATFSSWVVERATRGHEEARAATRGDIMALTEALRRDGVDAATLPTSRADAAAPRSSAVDADASRTSGTDADVSRTSAVNADARRGGTARRR